MLLSFDIEISDVFELRGNEDMEKYAPLHPSVAATVVHNGEERLWYSEGDEGRPSLNLTQNRAREMLDYLDSMQRNGFMVCAWNGLGFDLKWLGHQSGDLRLAANIAMKSYDPMFQFFNQTGFPIGLARVADAMKIPQKKLMDGADAPIQWRAGNHQAVMDYVLGDCQMTNQIILAIQESRAISWVTLGGIYRVETMTALRTVEEVINDPDPDQSWMSGPLPKSKFSDWAVKAIG